MKARIKETGEVLIVEEITDSHVFMKTPCRQDESIGLKKDLVELLHDDKPKIDWEQRRYELAKEAMVGLMHDSLRENAMCHPRTTAERCVILIDALVSKLRESQATDKFSSIVEQAPNLYRALSEIETRVRISTNVDWKVLSLKIRDIALSAIGKCK